MSSVALNGPLDLLCCVLSSYLIHLPVAAASCHTLDLDKHLDQPAKLVSRNLHVSSRISNQHHTKVYFHPNCTCLPRSTPQIILWWLSWIPKPLILPAIPPSTPALNTVLLHPSLTCSPSPSSPLSLHQSHLAESEIRPRVFLLEKWYLFFFR